MRKLKINSNRGITLIALVITIIVLLILVGVSIATLTGENGILNQASKAGEKTKNATEKEQLNLAYIAVMTENKTNGTTKGKLEEELSTKLLVPRNGTNSRERTQYLENELNL